MHPLDNRAVLHMSPNHLLFRFDCSLLSEISSTRQIFKKFESATETEKGLGVGSIFWKPFQRTGVRERENKTGDMVSAIGSWDSFG